MNSGDFKFMFLLHLFSSFDFASLMELNIEPFLHSHDSIDEVVNFLRKCINLQSLSVRLHEKIAYNTEAISKLLSQTEMFNKNLSTL